MRADAVANRRRVLAAAEEVFAERGVEASTEEVARRAGVGVGTVFRHFPSKRDLVEGTLVAHLEDLHRRALAAEGTDDATAALTDLVEQMADGGRVKIAMAGHLLARGDVGAPVAATAGRLREVIDRVLRRAQEAGGVRRDVGVDEIYFLVRGIAQAQILLPVDAATRRRATQVVVDGLRA